MGIYVGMIRGTLDREVFKSAQAPTQETHGDRYLAVIGPFRTMRAARFLATQYNNPHVQCVADAERIAKELAG